MEKIISFDKALLLQINHFCSPTIDFIMKLISEIWVWIPLYLIVIFLLFIPGFYSNKSLIKQQEKLHFNWKVGLIGLLIVVATFLLNENIASFVKDSTCRLRPSHDPSLENAVRLIDGKGGLYGFYSAHAANTMCFAVITSFIFKRRLYSLLTLFWSFSIGYSRIYLARHFPLDVLCGLAAGFITAFLMYLLYSYIIKKYSKKFV